MQNEPHAKKKDDNLCGAKTRAGTPCKNRAMPNGRCRMHGGKSTGAPPAKLKKNNNANKHGLFAKYLPKETMEIVNEIETMKPLDMLRMNIKMLFASIIRAQQIMFVDNEQDHSKELKKLKVENVIDNEGKEIQVPIEKEYEIQMSWDRQATFMNSLSRSMAEFRSMVKQYVELSTHDDDRLLEIKRMQSIVDRNNAEIERISGDNENNGADDWVTAIEEVARKRRMKNNEQ